MSALAEPRYEQGRPMLFAGLRRHHPFADVATGIPRQWEDFMKLGRLRGQVGTTAYGAICGGDPEREIMEYMCAVEVGSFDGLPTDVGRMRVPAATYAVFVHEGDVAAIRSKWQRIFSTWLPRSGMRSGNTPDFEVYDERFDVATSSGVVEIWVPVVPAT